MGRSEPPWADDPRSLRWQQCHSTSPKRKTKEWRQPTCWRRCRELMTSQRRKTEDCCQSSLQWSWRRRVKEKDERWRTRKYTRSKPVVKWRRWASGYAPFGLNPHIAQLSCVLAHYHHFYTRLVCFVNITYIRSWEDSAEEATSTLLTRPLASWHHSCRRWQQMSNSKRRAPLSSQQLSS